MVQSVYDLIRERFGGNVSVQEDAEVTQVGVASALLLRANPQRAALLIINTSSNSIFIRPREAATTAQGIQLGANGGNAVFTWEEDFALPTLEWHAIAGGANSDIFVLSVILEPGSESEGE